MTICCMRITPCLFFFFNHIFVILGALIVGCGIWILLEKSPFATFLQVSSPSITMVAYALIAVGSITLLKGFLGCASTLLGVRCFLGLYITCLLFILACQVASGLFVYFQETGLKARMTVAFREFLQVYDPKNDTRQPLEVALDYVQSKFSCCGWSGPENWLVNTVLQERNLTYYPCSCDNDTRINVGFCPLAKTAVPGNTTVNDWPVSHKGCKEAVFKWMEDNFDIIFGVSMGLAITEVLGMVLAFCICKKKGWLC